jgi:hypothetical protein
VGEFDNIHPAPGMIWDPLFGAKKTNIKMAPFCVHDCFHTHFRWGSFLKGVQSLPRSDKGFVERIPNGGRSPSALDGDGRPLVPSNQTVKIGLTGRSSFRYIAKNTPDGGGGAVFPGTWTVFYHHGSGYAPGIASATKWQLAWAGVAAYIDAMAEPGPESSVLTSTPAFYYHLRWTDYAVTAWSSPVERLQIVDLSTTSGVRS